MKKIILFILIFSISSIVALANGARVNTYRFGPFSVNIKQNSPIQSTDTSYIKYIEEVLDKNTHTSKQLEVCEEIRKLPETTPLSRAQLYALKIAARYRIYYTWAKIKKDYPNYKSTNEYGSNVLNSGRIFYEDTVRYSKTEEDKHLNKFFLGVFEYVTGNTAKGTKIVNDELSYFNSQKSTQNQADLLSKIFDLTVAFCKKGTTVDDIMKIINSIN